MARIQFTQTQSGINKSTVDQDKTIAFLLYSDVIPAEWIPSISAWVTATDYVIGDKVYDSVSKNYYVANVDHTAGATFATDVAKWDINTEILRTFKSLIEVEAAGILKDSADYKILHYQISEVYRANNEAILSIYIAPKTGNAYNFAEIYAIQKQLPIGEKANAIGIFGDFPVVIGTPALIKTQLDKVYSELEVKTATAYFSGNYDAYTDVASLLAVDFSTVSAQEVMHVISQDGDAYGYSLQPKNLGNVGAVLGLHSITAISDSIGDYNNNVASDNYEMREPMLVFGEIKVKALTYIQKENLNNAKHILFSVFPNEIGTRLYSDKTCVSDENDYNQVNRNRVWARIYRDLLTSLNPLINAKFLIQKGTGLLKGQEVTRVEKIVALPLAKLLGSTEISDYNIQVKNEVNFATTRKLDIVVEVVPTIINEKIVIALGFTV